MSDNVLRFLPTRPDHVPPDNGMELSLERLRQAFPDAQRVDAERFDSITFIDAGGNLEATYCPLCGAELDQGWWLDAMDRASEQDFARLAVTVPCCDAVTDLNELRYHWPQGFARVVLEVLNPGTDRVPEALLAELRVLVGCELRLVRAHY